MFKKLKASLGMGGGAGVETVLDTTDVRPGDLVSGSITVQAGEVEQQVSYLEVALQARVEVEGEDAEWESDQVFHRHRVAESFALEPGSDPQTFTFELQIPEETPFNVVAGRDLPKVVVGVRTELEIARALDATDVDPLRVHALDVQESVLASVERLGFAFSGSDLEQGSIPGSSLPFYQEVEYRGSSRFPGLTQLEVTFLTGAAGVDVIFEGDRRGGFLSEGGDSFARVSLPLDAPADLDARVESAIEEVGRKRGLFG